MSLMESVRTYFCGCPYLRSRAVNVDYLSAQLLEYTLDSRDYTPVLTEYAGGGALMQFCFDFSGREAIGEDPAGQLSHHDVYERVARWLRIQSDLGILPELDEGRIPLRFTAQSGGYMLGGTASSGRYRFACRLTYYEDTPAARTAFLAMPDGSLCRMRGFTELTEDAGCTLYTRRYLDEDFVRAETAQTSPRMIYAFDPLPGDAVQSALLDAAADGRMLHVLWADTDSGAAVLLPCFAFPGKGRRRGELRAAGAAAQGSAVSADGWSTAVFTGGSDAITI